MEGVVVLGGGDDVVGVPGELVDEVGEAGELRVVDAFRGDAGDGDLERRADLVELEVGHVGAVVEEHLEHLADVVDAGAPDAQAGAGRGGDDALGGEGADGLAHDGAGDAVGLAELALGGQPVAGLELAREDVVADRVGDLVGQPALSHDAARRQRRIGLGHRSSSG
ncbi:Uncharacterised protein [Mycobacteroides abscessus]|nr:Uncharacterised protein [Mycobacteroides abscessus]